MSIFLIQEAMNPNRAFKSISEHLGLYRQARWLNRHCFNREELRTERQDNAFFSTFIHPGDLVFDVGANVGEKSRVLLKLGARVVAFEPQSDCRAELMRRCGDHRNLHVEAVALGSQVEVRDLIVRQNRETSGFVADWDIRTEASVPVRVETLDTAIEKHGSPKFIKIDVEGFELEVLRGLNRAVPFLSFEYHIGDSKQNKESRDVRKVVGCVEHLATLGEPVFNMTPGNKLLFAWKEWKPRAEFCEVFDRLDHAELRAQFPGEEAAGQFGDIFVRMAV